MNRQLEEQILRLYSSFEPLHLLSTLTTHLNQKSSTIQAPHVQIAQALLLKLPNEQGVKSPPSKVYKDFENRLLNLVEISTIKRLSTVNKNDFFQLKKEDEERYIKLNKYIDKIYEFSADSAINFFNILLDETQKREKKRRLLLNKLSTISGIKKLQTTYLNLISDNLKSVAYLEQIFRAKKYSRKEVLTLICTHYDINIAEIYTFESRDFSIKHGMDAKLVTKMIEKFSYGFGDLAEKSGEGLANSIVEKPLMRLNDGKFYCSMPELFFGFKVGALED